MCDRIMNSWWECGAYRIFFLKFALIENFLHRVFHTQNILATTNRISFIVHDMNDKAQSKWIFKILNGTDAFELAIGHNRQAIA